MRSTSFTARKRDRNGRRRGRKRTVRQRAASFCHRAKKTHAKRVTLDIVPEDNDDVTEQELLLKLNLLDPGTAVTEQTLKYNADLILEYFRDRGFFKADVKYSQTNLQTPNDVGATFTVTPNAQATVENFTIAVEGFDTALLQKNLKLEPGKPFSANCWRPMSNG